MGRIREFFGKIQKGYKSLSPSKKISIGIILISLLLAGMIYYFTLGRTKYVPIFTNLELEDSGQIVEKLEEMKVTDYRVQDGGRTVMVSEKEVDKLRLDLAMNGILPNSGNGFELFDDAGFAITDEDRKILFQRALEGELQRSIMSLKEVERARVHLALAEESIFTKEEKPGTASVVLKLKPLETLDQEQVRGIISLVSGAVKNLPEENVRVVDDKANILSDGIASNDPTFQSTQGTSQRMEIKKQFEEDLQKDLNSMLEKTLGVGKVLVKVNADMDFDSQESTVISYDKEGIIRSQQIRIDRNGNVTNVEGGSPIDENSNYIDPNVEGVIDDEDTTSYESVTNNEFGETTTYTVKAPGEVKRISTSVIYDGTLTPAMQGAIQNIVMAATGFDMERGDMINVEGMDFDTSYQDQLQEELAQEQAQLAEKEAAKQKLMMYIGIPAGIILAILIVFGIIRIARRKKEEDTSLPLDVRIDEPIPTEEIVAEPLINIDSQESTEERSVKDYAEKNPEKMAELIRAWIIEDER